MPNTTVAVQCSSDYDKEKTDEGIFSEYFMQFSLWHFVDRKALMGNLYCFFICCAFMIHISELCEVTLASYFVFKVTTAQLCYLISTVVQMNMLCWQLLLFEFFARSTAFIPGNDKILGWALLQASILLRVRVTCSDFLHPHILNHGELWINEASAVK